jgi:hypothetical protein
MCSLLGSIGASDNCAPQFKCRHSFLGISRLPRLIRAFLFTTLLGITVQSVVSASPLVPLLWLWAGAGFFKWRHDTARV